MTSRAESAAATRSALVAAAADLLDEGGPEAVTLRAVGARAGVSRGAPYGHFASKDDLLTALAVEAWDAVSAGVTTLLAEEGVSARERLQTALAMVLDIARSKPHLYALMFTVPADNHEPLAAAASVAQDAFLELVTENITGTDPRRVGALLMATAHGVASMELAGQLNSEKWGTNGEQLLDMVTELVTGSS